MISLNAINVGGLIDNLDLIWTIVFWAILGVLLFSFGLGMLRGWKAGTYRFIFLSILTVTLLALLGVFANAAGQFNLANVTSNPITMTINGVTVSSQPGPLFETLKDLSFQILRDALHVKAPIETLQNYAIALAASTIRLVLVGHWLIGCHFRRLTMLDSLAYRL